ncbi:hypothetical protein [Hoeflea ulvae]|uniref:SMODS and SLOG-associating 2TM effector domain-containing protein n=1 Tax=Hoeflea ulvae TaxID=2983764 RepID=A0ABT3YHA9_9HYPH|nr:hypothetical protein [Hoeflea ulvae]MCY0095293.1 hypothetical protein [Hoeflea ulvae]
MKEALDALDIAFSYAESQIYWYQWNGTLKFWLHRFSGVFAILSAVFVAYLSASSSDKPEVLFGYKRNKLISLFAFASAVTISLSSFFAWENSWRSHRIAQFQLESAVNSAKIEKLKFLRDGNEVELLELAGKLSMDVGAIVLDESAQYFNGLNSTNKSIETGRNAFSG